MGTSKEKSEKQPDILDDKFEITYDGNLSEPTIELGNDAYKDVLSQLSLLDDEGESIDYLAANKTRTLRFLDSSLEKKDSGKNEPGNKDAGLEEVPGETDMGKTDVKKGYRKVLWAAILIIVLFVLMFLAYRIS